VALDQGEETERIDVDLLRATLRLRYKGITPPYKQLYTANPADCWLKKDFIDDPQPNHYYIPALPSDNPHLPESYIPLLKQIFQYNPGLLRAYLNGDWTAVQALNVLIPDHMLSQLKNAIYNHKGIRKIVVMDPSAGGDECVIYYMENYAIKDQMIIVGERDPMKVAGHMVVMAERHKCPNYAGDTIGIGWGVLGRVKELKRNQNTKVIEINSAEKSDQPERFANTRAEIGWYAMERVLDKHIPYPEDEELRRQITAVHFKVINSNGKIILESKDEIKKRLGCSPDRGDAWYMGIWATSKTDPIKHDAWASDQASSAVTSSVISAMTA
jgi:hypothetical protein